MPGHKDEQAETPNLPQVRVMTDGEGSRIYKDIPDYRTADADTRAKMDVLIATVDPFDINTILAFASEANNGVLGISRRINDRVSADEGFMADIRGLGDEVANLGMDSLGEKLRQFAEGSYKFAKGNVPEVGAAAAGFLFGGPLGALAAGLGTKIFRTGAKQIDQAGKSIKGRVTGEIDYEAKAEEIRDELRKSVLGIKSIAGKLESAQEKIPGYIEEINEMGRARVGAYSNLTVAIGAGYELLRRYQEEVLPAFQNNEAVDLEEAEQIQMSYDAMGRRVDGLIAARGISLQNITMLQSSLRMYSQMQFKINEHLTTSVPEWEGQVAQGNLIVDQFDLQQSITAADKKGLELMRNQEQLHDAVKAMSDRSQQQGTYNLTEVAKAIENRAKKLETDMKNVDQYRLKHGDAEEKARTRLLEATSRLDRTFQESAQQRVRNLLAGPSTAQPLALEAPAVQENAADKARGLLQKPQEAGPVDGSGAGAAEAKPAKRKGPTPAP